MIATPITMLVFGPKEALGFALGLAATALSLGGWKLLLGMMAKWDEPSRVPKLAAIFVLLVFFVKLPLFVVAVKAAYALGGPAPTWFLIGLAWVYSALVGWAAIFR